MMISTKLTPSSLCLPAHRAVAQSSATPEARPIRPGTPKPVAFEYGGVSQGGFYRQVRDGQGGQVDVQGRSFRGQLHGMEVDLQVKTESQVTDFGGMLVETGQIQHVSGRLNGQPYSGTITAHSEIVQAGGLHIETGRTYKLNDLALKDVSETTNVGGLLIQSDRYTAAESPQGKAVVRGLDGSARQLTVQGDLPAEQIVLIAVLRPFLS
jgi:hypothetical protein